MWSLESFQTRDKEKKKKFWEKQKQSQRDPVDDVQSLNVYNPDTPRENEGEHLNRQ